jgi:hypothetical protein
MNEQVEGLRVELKDSTFMVFPYNHLSFARIQEQESGDLLTISFTTHDIEVTGRNLREIGVALQKKTVDWIRETPTRYATLTAKDSAFIAAIELKDAAERARVS